MTISVIRPYTDADAVAIERAADRFCKRHSIENDPAFIGEVNVEWHIDNIKQMDPQEGKTARSAVAEVLLPRLWTSV